MIDDILENKNFMPYVSHVLLNRLEAIDSPILKVEFNGSHLLITLDMGANISYKNGHC